MTELVNSNKRVGKADIVEKIKKDCQTKNTLKTVALIKLK